MKYTKFTDIPQFTRSGSYQVNVSWDYLEYQIARWQEEKILGNYLDLSPLYQRCHVWTEEQQRRYVEYILKGGKSSRFLYFNCSSWGKKYNTPIELVDGKQRLEAVRKFLRNELTIFDGALISDFTQPLRMSRADFIFIVNDLATQEEVLQWYIDLNSSGTPHTDEEIEKVKKLLAKEQKTSKVVA